VVACDAAGEIAPAIEAGSRLAAHWHARLHVIFVEDPTLRLLAGHPQVRHVSLVSVGVATIAAADMEHMFLAMAARARSMVAEHAGRHGLDWSFAVVSAAPSTTSFGMAENDLLVVEGTARPFAGQMRLRSCFSTLALAAASPVLMIRPRRHPRRIVAAALGPDSPGLRRALAAAGDMAAAAGGPLTVLAGPKAPSAGAIGEIMAASGHMPSAGLRIQAMANPATLHNIHESHLRQALLVLDGTEPSALGDLEALAAKADCDILLVR
jgi:nucleotide-binding universal stress UspA family protein